MKINPASYYEPSRENITLGKTPIDTLSENEKKFLSEKNFPPWLGVKPKFDVPPNFSIIQTGAN